MTSQKAKILSLEMFLETEPKLAMRRITQQFSELSEMKTSNVDIRKASDCISDCQFNSITSRIKSLRRFLPAGLNAALADSSATQQRLRWS